MEQTLKDFDFLVVTHNGTAGTLYFADLDDEDNKNERKKVPVYLSDGDSTRYLLTDNVIQSYEEGSICKFRESGFIDTLLIEEEGISEARYEEFTYGGNGLPSLVETWESSSKETKTEELQLTYDANDNVVQTQESQFDADGSVFKTTTCNYSYDSQGNVIFIDCTES